MQRNDRIWQSVSVAQGFLEGVRGAIPLAAEQLDVMLRLIQAARPETRNFLDLGCGDGVLGQAILSQFPDAQGVFLDFSEPMIEAARRRLLAYGQQTFLVRDYGEPSWVQADINATPFDVVVSGFSIHHQPDERKQALYSEIYRLLTPGGIFINIEHVAPVSAWIEDLFSEVFIDRLMCYDLEQGISRTRDEVAEQFRNRPDKEANILTPLEKQCAWLRESGFIQVDCYLKIFELAVFGGIRPL